MKITSIIILFLAILPPAKPKSPQPQSPIFSITTFDQDGKAYSGGNGFIVESSGICVTGYQILENAFSAEVKMQNGEKLKLMNIIDYDADADIIKFRLASSPNRSFPTLKISPRLPLQGEDILTINPSSGYTTAKGSITTVRKLPGYGHVIQTTMPIPSGGIGSPVINSKGEVIGLVSSTRINHKSPALTFAVSIMKLQQLNKTRNLPLSDVSQSPLETRNVKLSKIAISRGNIQQATKHINIELEKNPDNHVAWEALGNIYYNIGEIENSIKYYEKAYTLKPSYSNIQRYGISAATLGELRNGDMQYFNLAYNLFNELVRNRPHPIAYYLIGDLLYKYIIIYERLNPINLRKALDALDYSLQLHPFSTTYCKRGLIKNAMNDIAGAMEDYNNAIDADPQNWEAYHLRGQLKAFKMNNHESGISDAETALQLNLKSANDIKATILASEAEIYLSMMLQTGDASYIPISENKLDEAYRLTGNRAYLERKQEIRIVMASNKE
ncbi:MAG: trypsin-like peptidase domain-containing protein [Tannerellaceae bacterium]|jgi:tetratricopeptide (TPR) repeat protein|nr:trypsin-like peptidase domain-containing protein [Tannerellaceae bacterium]